VVNSEAWAADMNRLKLGVTQANIPAPSNKSAAGLGASIEGSRIEFGCSKAGDQQESDKYRGGWKSPGCRCREMQRNRVGSGASRQRPGAVEMAQSGG
jgi:hypothetical protein